MSFLGCYPNSQINVASSLAAEQKMKEEYPFSPPKVKYVSSPSQTLLYSDTPTLFFFFSHLLSNFLAELKTHKKVSSFLLGVFLLVLCY